MLYAVVDIETTGGFAESNGITEIAIHLHDGVKTIDTYTTLIDPGRDIPGYISGFTGITNEMVAKAPSFDNVAHKIFDLLDNNVFVAHNVNFDYSFVKHQLAMSGYDLNVKKLCTVRYSRKIYPGLKSYSLGNICGYLGIDINDRHRANGDAEATVILLEKLLQKDDGSVLKSFLKKGSKEYLLPPNLPKEQFENLPATTGVYYFHDDQGKIIYVGKAVQIQKRVGQHFGGNTTAKQKQDFLRNIHSITYTECATELMALILESVEIKKHWPAFNRAQKHIDFSFGLYSYEDQHGYIRICIDRIRKNLKAISTYRNLSDAMHSLEKTLIAFSLCPKLCGIDRSKEPCLPSVCNGACEQKESVIAYNKKASAAIEALSDMESFAIISHGFTPDEISCVLIENGVFYGMGYIPHDMKINSVNDLKEFISPMKANLFIRELLDSDSIQNWGKKISLSIS